jgi:hypothetical protein
MQEKGIREDQVTQVRGFADQRLRDKKDPLDPANRRISVIVKYLQKPEPEATPAATELPKPGEKSEKKAAGRRTQGSVCFGRFRPHEERIVHGNILFDLVDLNREASAGSRQSPAKWDFHSTLLTVVSVVHLRGIVAEG